MKKDLCTIKNLEEFLQYLRDCPTEPEKNLDSDCPLLHSLHIIGFHHKQGSIIEFSYPQSPESDLLAYLALPDCVHNTNTETFYFTYVAENSLKHCISCFCQAPNLNVTEEMNRNFVQKAIVVVSNYPYYGMIASHLQKLTKEYFEQKDFNKTQLLIDGFLSIQNLLKGFRVQDLYLGFNARMLIRCFKQKVMNLIKLILLQGRIVVFAKKPSLVSAFIYSLLSLFPGQLAFESFGNSPEYLKYLRQYGLPLQLFNDNFKLHSFFSIFQLSELEKPGFLVGCTNQMIVEHPRTSSHATVFVETNKIKFHLNSKFKDCIELNSSESKFMKEIIKSVDSSWGSSENWLQSHTGSLKLINKFNKFFLDKFANMALLRQKLQGNKIQTTLKVPKESLSSEYSKLNPKVKKMSKYKKFLKQGFKNKFIVQWSNYPSFQIWLQSHPASLSHLSEYCGEVEYTEVFYKSGKVYRGCLNQGKRNGKGILISPQYKYEGYWEKNKKHGKGTLTRDSDKYVYDGMWINGLQDGPACEIKGDCKYNGNFAGGKYNGYGIIVYPDNTQYNGEWLNGVKQGMGHWINGKGDSFKGEFVNDLFCGQGQFTYAEGDIFVGYFKDGQMTGVGEFLYLNGEVYKGEVFKDKPHGKGAIAKKSGIRVEGIFDMGELNRNDVVIYYEDGRFYEGSIDEKFKPHGRGVMHFPSNNFIPAVWVHGIQDN